MRILFLHGLGSQPGGLKPAFLRGHGHEVINPGLPDDDFDESVRIAQHALDQTKPDLVVGSSRGGAVALSLDNTHVPLVLIAPAWKNWKTAGKITSQVVILHSEHDDVVPIGDSRELLAQNGLPADHLIAVGDNHRMIDAAAFEALLSAIQRVGRQG
jgi:pimeloyl-ACP methyl ester carboxylesterase